MAILEQIPTTGSGVAEGTRRLMEMWRPGAGTVLGKHVEVDTRVTTEEAEKSWHIHEDRLDELALAAAGVTLEPHSGYHETDHHDAQAYRLGPDNYLG